MAYEKVNAVESEEDKARKASLHLWAAKALESTMLPDLTADQIRAVRETNGIAKKAIIEHPTAGQKISNDVSLVSSDPKVQDVAQEQGIATKLQDSIFQPAAKNPFKALLNEAKKVVSSEQKVSDSNASVEKLEQALGALSEKNKELGEKIKPSHKNYNVAKEILDLGLQLEAQKTKDLFGYKKQLDEYKQKIDDLLKLSKHLDALPKDLASYDLKTAILDKLEGPEKEKMKQCIQEVFVIESPESFSVTKEQVAAAKLTNTDKMSLYRTQINNLTTIEVADATHRIHQFLLVMNNTIRLFEKLVSAFVQKQVQR
jgi:hypothetical protein